MQHARSSRALLAAAASAARRHVVLSAGSTCAIAVPGSCAVAGWTQHGSSSGHARHAAARTLGTLNQQQQHAGAGGASSSRGRWSAAAAAAAAVLGALAVGGAAPAALADARSSSASKAPPAKTAAPAAAPAAAGTEPEYTAEEVAKHRTPAQRVWVTYQDGVYDVTDFVAQHPGGAAKIMLAAGGSVEPFWGMYQQHTKPEVQALLKQYRIGRLKGAPARHKPLADPYANEPPRHPALIVRSGKPFNGETPPELLTAAPVTPVDVFYVRGHLPVPTVDADTFELKVEGAGMRSVSLTLADLQQHFKKVQLPATLQCAGNRRAEMKAQPAPGGSGHTIKGLDWDAGAIGTAVWGGVLLRDVLLAAGLQPGDASVAHIHFYGADVDESGTPYAASIPVAKAMAEAGDVLLAWEMNGAPLPRDHGGPLRVVVPGTTGARSVKWLDRVVASADECQGHWQQRDYKAFSPGTDWDNLDWSSAPAIQEMPVVSAICEPAPGTRVSKYDGEVVVRGYAWSGGGRDIIRVDVSADGGKHWAPAQLQKLPHSRPERAWAWTLWEATLPLPEGHTGPLTLACKATDAAYNTQPEGADSVWNIRGLANNAWHRVVVEVE